MPENQTVPVVPAPARPAAQTATPPKVETKPPPHEHKNAFREAVETIVFVVFLVLLLKAFVAEAFVIPTGSMATTLFGYHRQGKCEHCGYPFTVNASEEADNNFFHRPGAKVEAWCANCRHVMEIPVEILSGGDKVLVSKPAYDLASVARFDVGVFKYPGKARFSGGRDEGPQKDFAAHNYIKRIVGLPGEKLSIWYGDLYLLDDAGDRKIIRKPPSKMFDMRRNVYDADFPADDLTRHVPPRWQGERADWKSDEQGTYFQVQAGNQPSWLRYHHRLWPSKERPGEIRDRNELEKLRQLARRPQLITDFLDYNSQPNPHAQPSLHWVSDLMIDFEVTINEAKGQFVVELVAGPDRHQATFDLAAGQCTLKVLRDGKELARDSRAVGLTAGQHTIQFANFDHRLTLWLDGKLPFGDGLVFPGQEPKQRGPLAGDLRPVGIAAENTSLTIRHLKLWRDIYYSQRVSPADVDFGQLRIGGNRDDLTQVLSLSEQEIQALDNANARPAKWEPYYDQKPLDYDVPEGEYFALGDNSTQSKDSRDWGSVPERLLLGKALFVYWPYNRFGPIR